MKSYLLLLLLIGQFRISNAQNSKSGAKAVKEDTLRLVQASCGQCQFKMEDKGCDLAIRMKGQTYIVDGTNIDDHGDAHAKDGFCQKIRMAEVKGKIIYKHFVATYFKLLPETSKTN